MHIHLDAIGGVAGDMFIAAVLDAFPELRDGMLDAIRSAGLPEEVGLEVKDHVDHALTGLRFIVDEPRSAGTHDRGVHDAQAHHHDDHGKHDHGHGHHHDHDHPHEHGHTPFRDIRAMLERAPLALGVKTHALGIFSLVAEAEAKVHGKSVDDISFHELGEWDSIADVVGAAFLIDRLAARWTVSALPQGSGRVHTAHGYLPVPTPATVLLLQGFEFQNDGIPGERVTPTGAAILAYLNANQSHAGNERRLVRSGSGFGTRTLPGMSNVLRLLAFEASELSTQADEVAELVFEVDDQTPEDLSIGLDKLRAHPSVLDVVQAPVFGKKGRMAIRVQVLADPIDQENVINACFAETTTLGVRYQVQKRRTLLRRHESVDVEGRQVRVKIAERPGGATVKAESDDLSKVIGDRQQRQRVRHAAESQSLKERES